MQLVRSTIFGIFFLGPALAAPAQEIVVDQPTVDIYEGMWIPWHKPGSGLVIDQQDDTLVVTIFTYDEDGDPVWYLASDRISQGVFEAHAFQYRNGACLYCPWRTPEAHGPETIRIEFIAQTIGWMTWGESQARPIRALPFDVPMYSEFFADYPPFNSPGMYNLSGRWIFISESTTGHMLQTPLFELFGYVEPGGAVWNVAFGTDYGGYALHCRDQDIYPQSEVPHCVYGNEGLYSLDVFEYPISFFWGDTAPDRMIGYEGLLKSGANGDIRGTPLVQGFRLTGPVVPEGSQGFPAESAPPAVYIEKGMWFNPEEPGSGLMLDWQHDTLVFTIFTYNEDGSAAWYQGSGKIEGSQVSGEASRFEGGTCLSCEYQDTQEAQDRLPVWFEFESKTTAWLRFDDGPPKPISAVPFDVPVLRAFGTDGDFGRPYLYDLRGEWVFVSTEGMDRFFRRVTFTQPAGAGDRLAWQSADGSMAFRCDADGRFASPQCRLLDFSGESVERLLSAHWADVGEDQIIGYEEPPLSGEDGRTRGERLIFGFRLTGPGED